MNERTAAPCFLCSPSVIDILFSLQQTFYTNLSKKLLSRKSKWAQSLHRPSFLSPLYSIRQRGPTSQWLIMRLPHYFPSSSSYISTFIINRRSISPYTYGASIISLLFKSLAGIRSRSYHMICRNYSENSRRICFEQPDNQTCRTVGPAYQY